MEFPPLPPEFDPDALTLRRATESEKIQTWRQNSDAWKGSLSVDDYIGLQACNGNQNLTRDGGIIYWVLIGHDGIIYCSAETLRKQAVVCDAGHVGLEWSYGIAAVFTPRPWRRRGIATALMNKLAKWFDSDEAACRFSILFSAVGGFYESFGWSTIPTKEIRIPASVSNVRSASIGIAGFSEIKLLTKEDVGPLCQTDEEAIKAAMESGPCDSANMHVSFLPTYSHAEWHFGAEEYVASKLPKFDGRGPPLHKGAQVVLNGGSPVSCYWVHDLNAGRLTILRVVAPSAPSMWYSLLWGDPAINGIGQILQAAVKEAGDWGLDEVAVWDPDPRIITACQKLLNIKNPDLRPEIESYLPCIRLQGHGKSVPGVKWTPRSAYQRC